MHTVGFQVMIYLGLNEIPRSHIMPRWTVEPLSCWMHRGHPRIGTCGRCRQSELYEMGFDLARRACKDDRSYKLVMKGLCELQQELSAMEAAPGANPAGSRRKQKRRLQNLWSLPLGLQCLTKQNLCRYLFRRWRKPGRGFWKSVWSSLFKVTFIPFLSVLECRMK
jgi:hypothetical protein